MAILQSSSPEDTLKSTTPEQNLAAAIVHQAWRDLRHHNADIRREALTWWGNRQALEFWDDLLDLHGRLLRTRPETPPARPRHPPGSRRPRRLAVLLVGAALVLASGCAPILARKLGVPQPPLSTRTWRLALAHREVSATLAAAALLVLALIPALAPVLQSPPLPQTPPVAQASVLPAGGLPSAPSTAPAQVQPQPWRLLMASVTKWSPEPRPVLRSRYATQDACLAGLDEQYGRLVSQYEAAIARGQRDWHTERVPGRLRWGKSTPGFPEANEAWCEERAE
jgi:hypothetical protein